MARPVVLMSNSFCEVPREEPHRMAVLGAILSLLKQTTSQWGKGQNLQSIRILMGYGGVHNFMRIEDLRLSRVDPAILQDIPSISPI